MKKKTTVPVTPITPAYVRRLMSRKGRSPMRPDEWPLEVVECEMALLKLKREIRRLKREKE
jgi:hypothetical protein